MMAIEPFLQETDRKECANRHNKATHHLPNTHRHHSESNIHDSRANHIAAGRDRNPKRIDICQLFYLFCCCGSRAHWFFDAFCFLRAVVGLLCPKKKPAGELTRKHDHSLNVRVHKSAIVFLTSHTGKSSVLHEQAVTN